MILSRAEFVGGRSDDLSTAGRSHSAKNSLTSPIRQRQFGILSTKLENQTTMSGKRKRGQERDARLISINAEFFEQAFIERHTQTGSVRNPGSLGAEIQGL